MPYKRTSPLGPWERRRATIPRRPHPWLRHASHAAWHGARGHGCVCVFAGAIFRLVSRKETNREPILLGGQSPNLYLGTSTIGLAVSSFFIRFRCPALHTDQNSGAHVFRNRRMNRTGSQLWFSARRKLGHQKKSVASLAVPSPLPLAEIGPSPKRMGGL